MLREIMLETTSMPPDILARRELEKEAHVFARLCRVAVVKLGSGTPEAVA
jgi:hypothetical protein